MTAQHLVYTKAFELVTSNGDIMPLFIFQYGLTPNTEVYTKIVGGGSADLGGEGCCWKILHLTTGLDAMPHKQENSIFGVW